jgi:hypothetical protein
MDRNVFVCIVGERKEGKWGYFFGDFFFEVPALSGAGFVGDGRRGERRGDASSSDEVPEPAEGV